MPQNTPARQAFPASHPPPGETPTAAPRLQTVVERLGLASRRGAAALIQAGEIQLNGERLLEPGFRVAQPETATLTFRGKAYTLPRHAPRTRTIMLNKPAGLICSSSDVHGATVFDCIRDIPERLVCVGRLDRNSDGLLLLSNDGDRINRLTHPRYGHAKQYRVVAAGGFSQAVLDFLNSPIKMDGYQTRPAQVTYLERLPDGPRGLPRHRLDIILREGRNRQIRNMCEQAGLRVQSLTRIAINDLQLPRDLPPGAWRDLTPADLDNLEHADTPTRPPQGRGRYHGE